MKCFYILIYFMVGNILFSNGQTISGIVKDSSDDTPVAGVNIVMPFLKKGTGTNARGEFFFKNVPAGEYELHFSFVGMKDVIRKVKVEANKDLKLEVYMQMDMKSLDQVVVAAKGERKEIHDVKRQGTPVAVIDGKQLAGRGTTITEVLNHQTGVKLRQTGGVGNQTKVNIRGLDGKNLPMQLSAHWQKNGSILYLSFGEVMHNVKEHSSTAVSILCLVRPTPHLCRPTTASSETSISVRPMHI